MPGRDLQWLSSRRDNSGSLQIVLSARDKETDKVAALDAGAPCAFVLADVEGVGHVAFTKDDVVRHELVVLVLRPLDPEHVIEQQVVVVRRGQSLQAELGSNAVLLSSNWRIHFR